jgi:type V secretory pathway adhesin AidA
LLFNRDIMKAVYWFILILFIGTVILGFAAADLPVNATGYLQVSSTPSGAEVYLDTAYMGITPESGGFINITNLTPREYSLFLKKTSYLDYISTVRIVPGGTVKVNANLTKDNATSAETPVNPGNSMITVALVVIFLLIVVGFVALNIRKRRKPEKPEKIELD